MRAILIAMGLAVTSPLMAQTAPEAIVTSLVTDPAIPAATAGRVTADALSFAVAGVRVLDEEAAALPGDAWHVGSLTKSMTATLAARLVEAGVIGWDSTVGEVLGQLHPEMAEDWRDTPLHLLLTHGAGMAANLDGATWDWPRGDYVGAILSEAAEEEPGGFLYSNAGYVVAGAMLEAAGGASWEELMAAEVFGPLGLGSAGFGAPEGGAIEGHQSRLFRGLRAVGHGEGADNIPALGPAGRVHLSVDDMLRYLRAHLVQDEAYLGAESWARLHQPTGPQDYAMGWGVGPDGSLVHSGSNTFWYAVAFVDVAGGEAVFVAVNTGDLDEVAGPVDAALRELLSDPPG
jgi:CubicO group peptidase (beta-lactamase class C family)